MKKQKRTAPVVAMFAIVLWASTAVLSIVKAQQSGNDPRPLVPVLTADGLQKMLDDMGLTPKKLSAGFLISIKRDSWTYNIQVALSPDGSKIGMNANLGSVPKLEEVNAAQWLSLLEENEEMDPSAFYVSKTNQKLYIHRVMDNRAISSAYLRQQVDNFCANIKDTQKYWSFTK